MTKLPKGLEKLIEQTFEKNNRDYWEAHAQFGTDVALRNKWFHDVGFDAGALAVLARAQKLAEAFKSLSKSVPYNSIEPDYLIEARASLAEWNEFVGDGE